MSRIRIGKIRSLLIAGVIAGSLVLGMWTYNRIYATDTSTVTFGPAWHYVGNVTLTGSLAQQVCYAFPIPPCNPHITFPAKEYNNSTATAYLVVFTGELAMNVVIINSVAYCNTASPSTYIRHCPSVIN
jgi:hypothetical protein